MYGVGDWGRDIIAKTSGTMTLLFNGLKASDIVQQASGGNMVITRADDAQQSITVQGWNAASHKIVFGNNMQAVDNYLAAATPTAAQAKAAHNEAWKKAGLA